MPSKEKTEAFKIRTRVAKVLVTCLMSLSIVTGSNVSPELRPREVGRVAFADFYDSSKLGIDLSKTNSYLPFLGSSLFSNSDEKLYSIFHSLDETEKENAAKFVVYNMLSGHGLSVLGQFESDYGRISNKNSIQKFDLFSHANSKLYQNTDDAGNIGYYVEADIDSLENWVKMQPDNTVFNFSFQLGKFGMSLVGNEIVYNNDLVYTTGDDGLIYPNAKTERVKNKSETEYLDKDGKIIKGMSENEFNEYSKTQLEKSKKVVKLNHPYTSLRGALTPENPYRKDNFKLLVDFANKFPNKLFVLAAGNYRDNYTDLDDFPSNVVVACKWVKEEPLNILSNKWIPAYGVKGKGMFCVPLDNGKYKETTGTSFAAPVITAEIAKIMKSNNVSPFEARDELKKKMQLVDGNYVLN